MVPSISIVVPAYQEVDNIEPLSSAINEALSGRSYELIIVDDASNDGTMDTIDRLKKDYPIEGIERHATPSLAQSVLMGFTKARGDVVVLMDADLSHPANKLPKMVDPILEDHADLTLGSRYLSNTDHPWPWYRQWISKAAGYIGHWVCPISDPTTGFMAIRRSLLTCLTLDPKSWKVALEIATRCKNHRIKEIPFVFKDRIHGESKLSWQRAPEFIYHLWKLRTIEPLPAKKHHDA